MIYLTPSIGLIMKNKIHQRQTFSKSTTRNSSFTQSKATKVSTSPTNTYHRLVPHTLDLRQNSSSRQIVSPDYDSFLPMDNFLNQLDPNDFSNETIDHYTRKNLSIINIQPKDYYRVRKEFKWWPLENLQKFLLKKFHESEDESLSTRTIRRPQRSRKESLQQPRSLNVSVINDPLEKSYQLNQICQQYLDDSKRCKQVLNSKEKNMRQKLKSINLGQDDQDEKGFQAEKDTHKEEEAQNVKDEFQQISKHFKAYKTFNQNTIKRQKVISRRIVDIMTVDSQRLSRYNY